MVTDLQIAPEVQEVESLTAQEETILETIKNLLKKIHVVTQNQLEVAETMPQIEVQDLADQKAIQALQEAEAHEVIQLHQEVVLTEALAVLLQAEEAQEVDDNLNQLF